MRRLGVLSMGWAAMGACGGHPTSHASALDALSVESSPSLEPLRDVHLGTEAVASWDGGRITFAELESVTSAELRNMEIQHQLRRYDLQKTALDQMMIAALLGTAAEKGGYADVDALLRAEVDGRIAEPTEAELGDTYLAMARQFGALPYHEARPLLRQQLLTQRQEVAYERYLDHLRADLGAALRLPYPELPRVEIPIADGDPVLGNRDAPVTVVEFADYDCSFCAKVAPTLRRLVDDSNGRIRVVFKDFPLSSHAFSEQAALAAHCAGDQGRYWAMSEQLYDHVGAFAAENIDDYARAVGLDLGVLHECLRSGRFDDHIREGIRLGHEAGVSAAPSFFVNGVFLAGAQPYEQFKLLVDLPNSH